MCEYSDIELYADDGRISGEDIEWVKYSFESFVDLFKTVELQKYRSKIIPWLL